MDPPRYSSARSARHTSQMSRNMGPTSTVSPNFQNPDPETTVGEGASAQHNNTLSKRNNTQYVTPDDTLGEFSFGPATRTTVVTTTTTTTLSFPPMVMKAPRHLHDLDPTQYPLATSATPQSMRKLHFNIGGQNTTFCEAENPVDTLNKVGDCTSASPFLDPSLTSRLVPSTASILG